MSNVVLSAGVRQNLLALQNTAKLMTITQNRLATGKKVNSALDNPVNFFTASGLQNRAGDFGALLDAMSNGVKTLQAADGGLTAITNTLQSMQSTLLQARQDKSFKATSYSIDPTTIGIGSTKYLTLTGGGLGSTAVNVALQTNSGGTPVAATAASVAGAGLTAMDFTNVAATAGAVINNAFGAVMSFADVVATTGVLTGSGNFTSVDVSGGDKSFTVDLLDGNGPQTVNLSQAASGGDNSYDMSEIQAQVDAALGANKVTVGGGGGSAPLTLTTVGTGYANGAITVGGTNIADLGFTGGDTAHGLDAVTPSISFDVAIDGGATQTVTINKAAVLAVGNTNTTLDSLAELQAIVDAQLGSNITVGTSAGKLTLTSNTTGGSSSVQISNYALGGVTAHPAVAFSDTTGITQSNITGNGIAAVTPTLTFNVAIDGGNTQTVTINQAVVAAVGNNDNKIDTGVELAAILQSQLNSAVTVAANGNGANGGVTLISATTGSSSEIKITGLTATGVANTSGLANTDVFGTPTSLTGGTNVVKTIDQIVNDINGNAALANKIHASNDNGKIHIENLATGTLTLTGISAGSIDGGSGTSSIGGNDVRANLARQFNDLRNELNKLAGDASFNGINLLNGDILKMTFNETGTSTLDIQAKDVSGNAFAFTATNLNISFLQSSNLDLDSSIDGLLDNLSQALNTTRSQASNFGSYLSIVENRQDFTKAMINTLQTGADNLTLADTNEEGANMLALQTRQQLSTTALSLAAQADQGVLRLFG